MTLSLSAHQTRLLRLKAQLLLSHEGKQSTPPGQVLKDVIAVQAQDLSAAHLSIRARSAGLTAAKVERERGEERSVVWTWCMRGTLHLINAQDARWLIPFLGPRFIAADSKRFRQLGWDEARADEGLHLLQYALAERDGLTRKDVIHLLEENDLPFEGQAPIHLIYRAALSGILCIGPNREKKPTYVPYKTWLGEPQPLPRRDALAEIAQRYLQAYGPAGPGDLATWSGLKIRDTREAWALIADKLTHVEASGVPGWMLKSHIFLPDELPGNTPSGGTDPAPSVRLLPRFDTYLLAYANRNLVVSADYARRIHPGGGIIHPVLLVDGRALGTWKTKHRSGSREVVITPFEDLAEELLPHIEAEVADMARFLDEEVVLVIEDPLQT